MSRLNPNHFSITPKRNPEASSSDRCHEPQIHTSADGYLAVTFEATLSMDLEAYEQLVRRNFKGVWRLVPYDDDGQAAAQDPS